MTNNQGDSLVRPLFAGATMKKNEVVEIIRSCKSDLGSRYGVQKVGLFGSFVREQQKKTSDIDILVSFNREIDLFDFIDLRDFLQYRLKGKVDQGKRIKMS